MRISRHLRRLRARWRLHRMEWEAMHRPLEPPPGYEHFHTEKAVFPGLRGEWKKKETWKDYRDGFKAAWKLYMHHFVPDPDIIAMEEKRLARDKKIWERKANVIVGKGEEAARQSFKMAQDVTQDVAQGLKDKRPAAEALIKDRVDVLTSALNEFTVGYEEGSKGDFSVWEVEDEDEENYSQDVVREDNKPVKYEVDPAPK